MAFVKHHEYMYFQPTMPLACKEKVKEGELRVSIIFVARVLLFQVFGDIQSPYCLVKIRHLTSPYSTVIHCEPCLLSP